MTITTALKQVGDTSMVEFRLSDLGQGIDPEIRDQIFEPFISSKHTVGVGMGLTVARHSLRNMGGDLNVEDRPGGGTIAVALHPVRRLERGIHHD